MDRSSRPDAVLGETILIVDDEAAIRSLFARALQSAGYATLEAADGREALAIIGQQPVALALVDRTMPGLNGPALIHALRERGATRALPIILVTGQSGVDERVSGLEAGADDYLVKPVVLEELLARVRAQLRISAAWSETAARELAQRRALTAALHGVRLDASAEQTARSIADEVSSALGGAAVSVLAFVGAKSVIPLASCGPLEELYRVSVPLQAPGARDLRDRAAGGPWIQHDPASDAALAHLPLDGDGEPLGVLVVDMAGTNHGTSGAQLARRLSQYADLADMVGTLLHPSLAAGQQTAAARAAVEGLIAKRAFAPHFQPIVRLGDGAVLGCEALARFSDGTPPDVRFAEAEQVGLGLALEMATLSDAVMAAETLPSDWWLSLNVSPSLLLADLPLAAVLDAANRPVVLELTEHAPVADYATLQERIAALGTSVRVAVDDAGSGYASLRHVLALRPQFVKLDISWIRGIDADPARQALVAGMVHFAAEVGCELIGEGIETEAERGTLMRLGVGYGQGYLLGRPQPPTAHT